MSAILFIGGGRIASALVAGLRRARHRGVIAVHDHNIAKLQALKRDYNIYPEPDLKSAVAKAKIIILAVRPVSVSSTLDEIAGCPVHANPLVVSLAAGIPLSKLRPHLSPSIRWARALPSPLCRIGFGLTAVSFDRKLSQSDRKQIRDLFRQVGNVLEMSETRFDAFNAAYSPAHGYHALAVHAKAAQSTGLDAKMALTAAAHSLADAILYWRETGQDLSALLQESATPGGTSAATLAAMDAAGFERIIVKGLAAGIGRAQANARLAAGKSALRQTRRQPR